MSHGSPGPLQLGTGGDKVERVKLDCRTREFQLGDNVLVQLK